MSGSPSVILQLRAWAAIKITLIDDDVVSLSNLQRQILYSSDDVGRPKVEVAKERLMAINPEYWRSIVSVLAWVLTTSPHQEVAPA